MVEKIRKIIGNKYAKMKISAGVILVAFALISTVLMFTTSFVDIAKADSWVGENYTTYTETDGSGRITVHNNTHITFTNMGSNEDGYVYDDKGAGAIGEFTIRYELEITARSAKNSAVVPFCVGDTVNDGYDQLFTGGQKSICTWFWSDTSSWHLYLARNTGSAQSQSSGYSISLDTIYYIEVGRDDTQIYQKIYSDKEYSSLLTTQTVTLFTDTLRYMFAFNSYNAGISATTSGHVQNLQQLTAGEEPSTASLDGLTAGRITWSGIGGQSVWCNSSGDGTETMDINMTLNATTNITGIRVWVGDMNDTTAYINASNIELYVSSDDTNYGQMGTYTDGGSNLSINTSTWNAGSMGTNPFLGEGLTNGTHHIYCRFLLNIPADTPTDIFYSASSDAWKVYIGYYE